MLIVRIIIFSYFWCVRFVDSSEADENVSVSQHSILFLNKDFIAQGWTQGH